MPIFKVLIDSRRKINSGVGRVSQWIANNVETMDCGDTEIVFLVNPGSLTEDYSIPSTNILKTSIRPFSKEEFYGMPDFLAKYDFDLYVNPQMSWSYLHTTPAINMIHDLWAIKNPEWLPSESDLKSRFGIRDISYFEKMASLLDEKTVDKYLTPYGISQWENAKKSGNVVWIGCWAQYAAVTSLSQRYVVVSAFVESEVKKHFKNIENIVLINNIPNNFNCVTKTGSHHFLTLSKIEKRKNLDYLLDSYIEYVKSKPERTLPLVIAGDPGYKSIADAFLNRISSLQDQGYKVTFKASVSDKELRDLLQNSAALIFPSHFEGFGLPPLEAMLAEVPVIATPTGMMAAKFGKFITLIDGKDTYKLAKHMRMAATDQYPKQMIDRAKDAVIQFIDESKGTPKWGETIRACLHSSMKPK